MGRRAHVPDPALRRQVETLAAYGIPETDISRVVGIDPKTLRKHYGTNWTSAPQCQCPGGGFPVQLGEERQCLGADLLAQDTGAVERSAARIALSGCDGRKPVTEMTDEELMARIEEMQGDLNLAPPMKTVNGTLVATIPADGSRTG